MYISNNAIKKWNAVCKKKGNKRRTIYKIARAICLGDVVAVLANRGYLIRYFDLNIVINKHGRVVDVGRVCSMPLCEVDKQFKAGFRKEFTHRDALWLLKQIHKTTMDQMGMYQKVYGVNAS
ncbi:hypothetical protein [Paenibacillus chitinolyticus]|uniref:hypothetical protein n=1 Tax=Paenibacillus chitinolyticus TaxID=79263 RepID=UPI003D080C4B